MADSDVTRLLRQVCSGDSSEAELLELVYAELKEMARSRISREADVITMGTTGLVHEAWLRIVGPGWPDIESRRHFFGIAAEAMRRIMIERARSAGRQKRGNHATRITLQEYHGQETRNDSIELVALDQALSELEARDSGMSQVVKLRYFCGLTAEEVAEVLEISPRTVDRKWKAARAWMQVRLG